MRWIALFILFATQAPAQTANSTTLTEAFQLGAQGDWTGAAGLVGQDVLGRDLITWTRLREGEGTFADYIAFVAARPDWPGLDRLRARGEEAIEKGAGPDAVIGFFADQPPQTGQGALRLAEAWFAKGQPDRAQAVLRDAWLELGLSDEEHTAMMDAFPDLLAPFHAMRTDAMLWRGRSADAVRMLPLLDADLRALAEARIAYLTKAGDAAAKLALVPVGLRDDPGLAYARYTYLANRGDWAEAAAILTERSARATALGDPFRWSGYRRILARWAMREGRADDAYALASRHHLTSGTAFADLEWLSGYISLRYLNKPRQALRHFQTFAGSVDSPISEGRGGYWLGRTYEALGDPDAAAAAFAGAAQNQTGFYGLLAAERLGLPLDPALTGREEFADWRGSPVLNADLTRAGLALLAADQRDSAVLFFVKLGQTLNRAELGQLGGILNAMNEPFFEVMVGKAAAARGMIIPALYFPLHDLRKLDLPVRSELALSIARQESEFNAGVGSAAGALGLMQLMPGTAEDVARGLALPYSRARLTSDWEYNARLGSTYLAGLVESFGYSPVQIAAGYNAGPGRPRQWMDERGDPRLGEVDVIDWIEAIPFNETRNYVQRVTESMLVYRARLSGETGPVEFTKLLIGNKPVIRPLIRPDRSTPAVEPASAPAAPVAPPAPSGRRPLPRPGG